VRHLTSSPNRRFGVGVEIRRAPGLAGGHLETLCGNAFIGKRAALAVRPAPTGIQAAGLSAAS
jgi:hypothetical protein